MRTLIRIIAAVILLILIGVGALFLSGNSHLIKALKATYLRGKTGADIDDVVFFDSNVIHASNDPSEWPLASDYNEPELSQKLRDSLIATETEAFLIIQHDSILFEKYWNEYDPSALSNSFSMAKSITTMLMEIAIEKGFLESWDQHVKDILPELKGEYADELQLWHLATMSSGIYWEEEYSNPFGIAAKAYFGPDVRQLILDLPIVEKPGQEYSYRSGTTQLMAIALIKATGMGLAEMCEKWLWQPMQATQDALWHTDGQGMELAYCCYNADPKNYARFGKLINDHGKWNDVQLIDSAWLELALTPSLAPHHGYSLWIIDGFETKIYSMRGMLGQYIVSIPEYDAIIMRVGHKQRVNAANNTPANLNVILEEVLPMLRDNF